MEKIGENMKAVKYLIGIILLLVCSGLYSAENIELNLFIFTDEPKIYSTQKMIREKDVAVIQHINEKFGFDLEIIIPKKESGGMDFDYTQQFEQKLSLALRQQELPDLIAGDESVLNKYELQKKPVYAEQIKKHAPYLYNQFTEKFWRYRDHTNDVYRIPIKKNVLYDKTGFWVMPANIVKAMDIYDVESLLAFLTSTDRSVFSREDSVKMSELRAADKFVMDSENIIMTTLYLHRLLGMDFGSNNIFYINRNLGEINIETILDEEIYNNFLLKPKALQGGRNHTGTWYVKWYRENEWAALHMGYNFPFMDFLLPRHMDAVKEYGNGKKYFLFHDIKFWNNLIWSKWDIEYVYVPSQSEKLVEVLQFLNKLQTPEMSNIFRYGIPGEDHILINDYEVELKNYPYYYRGLADYMEHLIGEPKLIFSYFPQKVKDIYIDCIKNTGKDLFSDIDYDDYRNKAVLKLFKDNQELVQYFMSPVDWIDDLKKGSTYEQEANVIAEEIEKYIFDFLMFNE
jgi:hypothetical protein